MNTIWKFPFEINDRIELAVPQGARLLHVGLDPDKQPCAWCLVHPDADEGRMELFIRGTGHDIEMGIVGFYFDSFIQGPFVWHVFVRP